MSNKLTNYDSHNLCQSEVKQLLNMDIPYFYVCASDINVKDKDGNTNIWKLKIFTE